MYGDQPRRIYRLEAPSMGPPIRHPEAHDVDHQNLSHASDRYYFNSQQPSTDYASPFPLRHHDRRYHSEETHHLQAYPQHS